MLKSVPSMDTRQMFVSGVSLCLFSQETYVHKVSKCNKRQIKFGATSTYQYGGQFRNGLHKLPLVLPKTLFIHSANHSRKVGGCCVAPQKEECPQQVNGVRFWTSNPIQQIPEIRYDLRTCAKRTLKRHESALALRVAVFTAQNGQRKDDEVFWGDVRHVGFLSCVTYKSLTRATLTIRFIRLRRSRIVIELTKYSLECTRWYNLFVIEFRIKQLATCTDISNFPAGSISMGRQREPNYCKSTHSRSNPLSSQLRCCLTTEKRLW